MKNKLIFSYYLLLILIVGSQAVTTAFNVGRNINYGEKIAKLEKQKSGLIEQKSHYERLLSQNMALYKHQLELDDSFTPITQTYPISADIIVASR
jgi:hypothetical protein